MNPALPKIVELMLRSLASKEGISIEYKDADAGGGNPVVDLNESLGGSSIDWSFFALLLRLV